MHHGNEYGMGHGKEDGSIGRNIRGSYKECNSIALSIEHKSNQDGFGYQTLVLLGVSNSFG